jgi:hypothetical protein
MSLESNFKSQRSDSTAAETNMLSSANGNSEKISSAGPVMEELAFNSEAAYKSVPVQMPKEKPSDVMTRRWKQIVESTLPAIDLIDLSNEKDPYGGFKVQFAPEYSHSCYNEMLRLEFAIGDYIGYNQAQAGISDLARKHMVTLMEDLNRLKEYKEKSLFLAASLADRYLVNLTV